MKKTLFVSFFAFLTLSNIYSQDKKHTVYVDFFPLLSPGLGIGYDYNIHHFFAVGGYANVYLYLDGDFTTNIAITGTYYPLKTKIGNLFFGGRLGYRRRIEGEDYSNHSLVGFAHTGWKFI